VPSSLRLRGKKIYLREGQEDPLLFDPGADPTEQRDLFGGNRKEADDLKATLDSLINARPLAVEATAVKLDGVARQRLESLGYLAPGDAGPRGSGDAGRVGGDE
jgi:hypothetical protein